MITKKPLVNHLVKKGKVVLVPGSCFSSGKIIPLYTKVKDKYGIESEKFYLRSGNSSPALETSEVVRYIRSRFDVFK